MSKQIAISTMQGVPTILLYMVLYYVYLMEMNLFLMSLITVITTSTISDNMSELITVNPTVSGKQYILCVTSVTVSLR